MVIVEPPVNTGSSESDDTNSNSDTVANEGSSTPIVGSSDNDSANEDNGWGNLTEGGSVGGSFDPVTDGYGDGVIIEITPLP